MNWLTAVRSNAPGSPGARRWTTTSGSGSTRVLRQLRQRCAIAIARCIERHRIRQRQQALELLEDPRVRAEIDAVSARSGSIADDG